MKKIGVFCASSDRMEAVYYEKASEFGRWLGETGRTLVYGGAASGLMEAVAKATKENGGTVYGIVPRKLFQNDRVSDYIDVTIPCEDLSDRKQLLVDHSEIMVVMPGSVGTFDEAFCALAANTFGLHSKRLIFWNVNGYYDKLFEFFDSLEGQGVLNKPWNEIMYRVNELEEIKVICGE